MGTILDHVAQRIKELRLTYSGGLSQDALAKAINVTPNTISRWETGVYKPAIDDLDKLARFFNASILTFFPREESGSPKTQALLRAAETLPQDDLDELQRFAEWRQAQYMLKKIKQPKQ